MKSDLAEPMAIESLDVQGLGNVTVGLKVSHPIFGAGVVASLFALPAGGATSHSIGVEFESVGYKALAPAYAKLQLL